MATRGNILLLEHINLNISRPDLAFTFYLDGLGCVLDPRRGEVLNGKAYANRVLWFNAGLNQFHLPITTRGSGGAPTNVLNGVIGIAYNDLDKLASRLEKVADKLDNSSFAWERNAATINITGPFGNQFVAHNCDNENKFYRDTRGYHPGETSFCLGIPYIEIFSPIGSSSSISSFYKKYLAATVIEEEGLVRVLTGDVQELRFRESESAIRPLVEEYCNAVHGFHIAIYLDDHLGSMKRLAEEKLLWGNPRFVSLDTSLGFSQFRFKDIVNPDDISNVIFELEHEVRGLKHESSPFSHSEPYTIPGRDPVAQLITSVTDEYEADFEAIRKENMAPRDGFVPNPLA